VPPNRKELFRSNSDLALRPPSRKAEPKAKTKLTAPPRGKPPGALRKREEKHRAKTWGRLDLVRRWEESNKWRNRMHALDAA